MPAVAARLPVRRPELVIRPLGEVGRYVVKDPRRGAYFHFGEQEHFLLMQLDGRRDVESVCREFEQRFGEALIPDDLRDFIVMAGQRGLLNPAAVGNRSVDGAPLRDAMPGREAHAPGRSQSLLYWRKSLFDPDALFSRLEPALRFCWTRGFLLLSAGCIAAATFVFWTGRHEIAASLAHAFRWESLLWGWLMILAVTALHEAAHGLTCKHFGGEVREIGFLLMYFMPCFYCNVSDAWLFREKSKRVWVTLAGGYIELFVWALSVFVWRLTVPGSFPNYLAFLVVVSSGIDSLFNFNPLVKLDGYYLLSDWLEIPNLRQRSWERFQAHVRRLLWGGPRPADDTRGRLLTGFGTVSWTYSLSFLCLMCLALLGWADGALGVGGVIAVGVLLMTSLRGLFPGFFAGEVLAMVLTRHKRTLSWLLGLGSLATVLCVVEIDDRAGAPCQFRSAVRAEVRAPAAGFIQDVHVEQGDALSPGTPIARLEVPDLESRLVQKNAEVREAEARLRLLEIGPRPEAVMEQRQAVDRATAWRESARHDLEQLRLAHAEDLARLDQKTAECRAELEAAQNDLTRTESLLGRGAATEDQRNDAEHQLQVSEARRAEAEAERRSLQARGTLEAEAELVHREIELQQAQSELTLLEAGSRPDEVECARSELCRLQEEVRYLESLQAKLSLCSPLSGVATTPRLRERVGNYVHEGDLICTVEDQSTLKVEITLFEDAVERIRPGQTVRLKTRGLPHETIECYVDRIAPVADAADSESPLSNGVARTVTVTCEVPAETPALRAGMTGYARISIGRRPIADILADRVIRFLRTEFWW